ncbi:MAG: PAS domain-containing protein [Gammaproteobacteria bacterium]|nr:PAS domain-containing protein [Gammaproteobacteria bacterium]
MAGRFFATSCTILVRSTYYKMQFDPIIENLQAAVVLVDAQQLVKAVNLAAESLFVRSRRQVIGRPLADLVPSMAVARCIEECIESHSEYTLREIELPRQPEAALVDMTLSSISRSEAPTVLIEINSINRISRFMRDENQLERQQSFRLMMRGLAHEIKNPLGGIRGAAQLLQRESVQPEQQELANILIKEADRLTRLVDRVMGSREQLNPAATNIHELLEHVINLVSVEGEQAVRVERAYDPALPEIELDAEQMIQALLNIVGNALEAQSAADVIEIGFETRFERFITIQRNTYRQALKVMIWDSGPGVSDDIREVLFDPLITSRAEGTGLGLSITQEIVQRHHGVVQLEDYHGRTCFSIYLPYINEGTTETNTTLGQNHE